MTPEQKKKAAKARQARSRKMTPAQIRIIAEKYYAGSNVPTILKEFQIGRSSLYRYLDAYKQQPDVNDDPTHWRIECERMKNLVVEMALENKRLRQAMAQNPMGATMATHSN